MIKPSSNRANWPHDRAELERKLIEVIQRFIANNSFGRDTVRTFAKGVAAFERALDHLDAVEAKAREIDRR